MMKVHVFFALFLCQLLAVKKARAIVPIQCANLESLQSRSCCPTPAGLPGAGPCGAGLGRGSCRPVAVPDSQFDPHQTDVRVRWPIQYFNSTCACSERFGGVDCGECSYAYNDGTRDCEKKTILPRKSVGDLTDQEWKDYVAALKIIKFNPARYVVSTKNFTTDLELVLESMVRPTTYDLFIWIHYQAAKDNTATLHSDNFVDYAHEGPGFPTWHRQLILWLEREIQVELRDHTFRLPVWDWRNPALRDILFRQDRLGENVNGEVVGDLFTNWQTFCWADNNGLPYPVPICDPTIPSNQSLRRCPSPNSYLCDKNGQNWPTYEDSYKALSIETYDAAPYTRFVEGRRSSFRNFYEGFVVMPELNCRGDTMCLVDMVKNVTIHRKLHNAIHIVVGIGDLATGIKIPFKDAGPFAFVSFSPNDPIFPNHHTMVDCLFEQWLQRYKDSATYPDSPLIRDGHGADDYMVPFIELFKQKDMFKMAENFGYSCPQFHAKHYNSTNNNI